MGAVAMGIDRIDHSAIVAKFCGVFFGSVHCFAVFAGSLAASATDGHKVSCSFEAKCFMWVSHLFLLPKVMLTMREQKTKVHYK